MGGGVESAGSSLGCVASLGCAASPKDRFTLVCAAVPSDKIKKAEEPKVGSHVSFLESLPCGMVATRQIKNRYVTSFEETALHSQRLATSVA